MWRNMFCHSFLVVFLIIGYAAATEMAGLILTGADTLRLPRDKGFDFINSQVCTTYSSVSEGCYLHFDMQYYGISSAYVIFSQNGYGFSLGKLNLDSIKQAPPDSVFQKGTMDRVDSIPPDSLSQYIGNVYVIKSGDDPRPLRAAVFAKIKILDFTVRNIVNHDVNMVFLWVANLSYKRDLTSANLDTFTLDYHVDTLSGTDVLPRPQQSALPEFTRRQQGEAFAATAVNGFIRLPAGMLNTGIELMIYDQRGRVLGRIQNLNARASAVVRVAGGYCGVVVVR